MTLKLNGVFVTPTHFPDGTSQIWKITAPIYPNTNHILWEFENETELMHLAQLRTLLGETRVRLHMPFLPYGRQDKEVSNETTFAVRTFAQIISSLEFDIVSTLDAHSDVFLKMAGAHNVIPVDEINAAIRGCNPELIGFPDESAERRYSSLIGKLPFITGIKKRDQSTGVIRYEGLQSNETLKHNSSVLFIDDICDGGMTFILFANFAEREIKDVHLYTTHGIYSKGLQVLRDGGIKRIFNRKGEVI